MNRAWSASLFGPTDDDDDDDDPPPENTRHGSFLVMSLACSYWLEKTTHVHAVFPGNCTDDLLFIEQNNCTELLWPKVRRQARKSLFPQGTLHVRESSIIAEHPQIDYMYDTTETVKSSPKAEEKQPSLQHRRMQGRKSQTASVWRKKGNSRQSAGF